MSQLCSGNDLIAAIFYSKTTFFAFCLNQTLLFGVADP